MEGSRKLFDDLIRFETMLWAAVDAALETESGLTLSAFNVMLIIDSTPRCRVLDIAEALAITVGGTSQAVDRLEKAGYCRRRPHPDDRRSSIVELTSDGVAMLRKAEPVFDRALTLFVEDPLSATELSHLASAVEKLRGAIAR